MHNLNTCPVTSSNDCIKYIDLGDMPLVNNLNNTKEESLNCDRYPLRVNYYPKSGLSALDTIVDGSILFQNYVYKSSVSAAYKNHCTQMFNDIIKYKKVKKNALFVDIGGNDGTLLCQFRDANKKDCIYLNVDPSENLCEISKSLGILTYNNFFNQDIAKSISTIKKADVVTSTNVFQHLEDINSFVEGIEYLLEDDGIWVLEFPYWADDLKTYQFDQIYHEHVYYYNVTPLKLLFEKYNLEIKKAEHQDIHGGTMRLYIAKKNSKFKVSKKVDSIIKKESKIHTDYLNRYAKKLNNFIKACKSDILKLKKDGYKIAAFGAAAKGCIFLNTLGLNHETIDYIIDDTDLKQGKYMPGTGIEICSRNKLSSQPVDYILILPHNFATPIKDSLIKGGFTGKFLQYLPYKK